MMGSVFVQNTCDICTAVNFFLFFFSSGDGSWNGDGWLSWLRLYNVTDLSVAALGV